MTKPITLTDDDELTLRLAAAALCTASIIHTDPFFKRITARRAQDLMNILGDDGSLVADMLGS